ncbi:uncharacterized protein LOC132203484 [Neocloeon triangulifer]|uniref:uncharacterized protein LOC132203484 n=1 Tax=Neocloeon triangulifer TaxID=2078957 RepID=UPI00286F6741|nr:uncharacterized protein LOC132203484 [Neocloeon triangulifer]
MSDLKLHVHPGDVIAAVKTLHGGDAALVDYEVLKGTETVQGFMSSIFRVRATCQVPSGEIKVAQFVVKRLPVMEAQRKVAQEMRLFDQEAAFFTRCFPLMKRKCPDLKVVECFFTHSASTIVMEDLGLSGFSSIIKNLGELEEQVLTLSHVRMVIRELAKFHASSQGTDWLKEMPELFERDVLLEGDGGKTFRQMVSGTIICTVVPLMKHIYKDDLDRIKKYTDWLEDLQGNVFPCLVKSCKADPRYVNALCHGDCWVNNFMFRSHPDTDEPLEIRFIDMQVLRYAPVYSDLMYLLYLSIKSDFRKMHEKSLLKTYVETFNSISNSTPDPIDLDQFVQGYDESRLGGMLFTISLFPLAFLEEISPPDGEELSEENLKNLFGTGGDEEKRKIKAVEVFQTNVIFRKDMTNAIADLIFEMDTIV